MNTSKIIRGPIGIGPYTRTAPITQWDYGYRFIPDIDDLPATYRIDFANNKERGEALPVYGDETGAEVPEELIATGKDVFAFYVHIEDGFARTAHAWRIPNHLRAKAGDREPTPAQQNSIDQAISALNTAVEKTSADVETTARNVTETDQNATRAEQARDRAEAARDSAANSADSAGRSAMTASQSAQSAELDRREADRYAREAEESATKAEQSAAQSGYLWFYIENGKLYMDRTANTQVDFFMRDGKLYVEEIA